MWLSGKCLPSTYKALGLYTQHHRRRKGKVELTPMKERIRTLGDNRSSSLGLSNPNNLCEVKTIRQGPGDPGTTRSSRGIKSEPLEGHLQQWSQVLNTVPHQKRLLLSVWVPTQKHTGLDEGGKQRVDNCPPCPTHKKHLLEKLGASVSAAQHPQTPEAMTLASYLDSPSPSFSAFCSLSWCLPLPTIHYYSKSTSQHMGTKTQCPWKDDKEGKGSLKPPTKAKIWAFQREEKPCWGHKTGHRRQARTKLGGTSVATYMRAGIFWRQQRWDMMVSHTGGRTQEPQASINDE